MSAAAKDAVRMCGSTLIDSQLLRGASLGHAAKRSFSEV